ncbi:glycerophosphodiester phosphodiesterase family protein [Martelella soudanensis]|uniref:glycerophosphodiester phosphodiesterase family protein n=1 Tax=unclassified Martelella TaxID=2629616 RepID=UPI0015DE173A|nr:MULTISPECIES: glycerophosphodiester phosphodiesterase family protein [unclassified Martelella]
MLAWLTAHPIAHRGYHDMNRAIWENTLPAFQRAIDADFAIECDIHMSADGVPMVFHDDDLERLCGRNGEIEHLTAAEARSIAVGGTTATIPALADLLDACGGKVPLVIELKASPADPAAFAEATLAALAGYDGAVALMSFDVALLSALKNAGSSRPLGLTAEGRSEEALAAHRKAFAIGLDFVSYYYDHLPNEFVAGLREKGVPVITWTVRNEEARRHTFQNADQMTFEGFDPRQSSSQSDA